MTNSGVCRTSINHWDNFPSHQLCKLNQKNYVQITLRAWHKPEKARQLGAKVEILPSLCPAMHWLFRRQAAHDHGKAVFFFLPGAPGSANHAMAANRSWETDLFIPSADIQNPLLPDWLGLKTVMLMDRLSYEPLTACVGEWREKSQLTAAEFISHLSLPIFHLPAPKEVPPQRNSSYGSPAIEPLTWLSSTFLVFLYYDENEQCHSWREKSIPFERVAWGSHRGQMLPTWRYCHSPCRSSSKAEQDSES